MEIIPPINPGQPVQPLGLPTVSMLFNDSWRIYKEKFVVFMKLYLWTILHSLVVVLPAIALGIAAAVMKNSTFVNNPAVYVVGIVLIVGALIYVIFLSLRMQVAQILTVKNRQNTLSAKELLNQANPFVGPYFWTSFLTGLLVIAGFIALIVPGILLIISTVFATYVVLDGNLKGYAAIKKSWQYTKGHYLAIAKYGIVALLLLIVLQFVPTAIFGKDIGDAISGILGFISSPFFVTYGYLMYESFKQLKPEVATQPV